MGRMKIEREIKRGKKKKYIYIYIYRFFFFTWEECKKEERANS